MMLSGIPNLKLKWPNKAWCCMLVEKADGLSSGHVQHVKPSKTVKQNNIRRKKGPFR